MLKHCRPDNIARGHLSLLHRFIVVLWAKMVLNTGLIEYDQCIYIILYPRLFWADSSKSRIESIGLDGKDRKAVMSQPEAAYFGLTLFQVSGACSLMNHQCCLFICLLPQILNITQIKSQIPPPMVNPFVISNYDPFVLVTVAV